MRKRRMVIVESPFKGENATEEAIHVAYARACMYDCLTRHNEFPFASHLLYTQPGILDDNIPEERELGIQAGFALRDLADATVVYKDFGITRGMGYGIEHARNAGRLIEERNLFESQEEKSAFVRQVLEGFSDKKRGHRLPFPAWMP